MTASLTTEIRSDLRAYLSDELDIDALEDRIVGAIWRAEADRDDDAIALAYGAKLALIERAAGDTSDRQFRADVESLAHPIRVIMLDASPWNMAWTGAVTSAATRVTEERPASLGAVFGAPRAAASS